MANTLTGLIPTLYLAADSVSRELTGLIPSVFLNATAEQAAKDQTITYPVAPVSSAADIAPGSTAPDTGDQTIGNDSMTISKARAVPIRWTGEEVVGVGSMHELLLRDQFTQAMRTLTNEVEADLAALYAKASRAYGTAGATPFGTAGDYTDASFARKILVDNGAPESDLRLVIDTTAGANLRGKQAQAHMAGGDSLQRQGVLLDVHGFEIRESAQIKYHTKGAGTGYDFVTAGEAIGQTTLTLEGGTVNTTGIKAGDIVTHAGDTVNKYVVTTGLTETGGDIVIGAPGLLVAGADANVLTVGNSYRANMAFARSAIHLICRVPAMPPGGDMADDVVEIMDPRSGLVFQVALYRQYRRIKYEIGLAWGVKVVKPEWLGLLLG